jgi:hypothetical protein
LLIDIELKGFNFVIKRIKKEAKRKTREKTFLTQNKKNGELFIVRRFCVFF